MTGFVIISPLALGEIDHVVAARVSRAAADRVLEQVPARVEVKRAADGQATDRPGAEAVVPLRDDGHRWDALQEYGAEREG
jgi:hypothetical protein